MAKRRFGLSIIVLIIAAATMVSGTYAWFLVGGFAELFDIGFDVMEATGGVELRGSATDSTWDVKLERDDFADGQIIAVDGKYAPVTSSNGVDFMRVGVEGDSFIVLTPTAGVDYNDFTLYARSTTEAPVDVNMKIVISGDEDSDATAAARVAVTYNGTTTIYALNESGATYAVTSSFTDGSITDDNSNRIIDSSDTGNGAAGLSAQAITDLDATGIIEGGSAISLQDVAAVSGQSEIRIKTWIEGNDADCIDVGENAIPGKNFSVKISFTTAG